MRDFMFNSTARVQINGEIGDSTLLRQGPLQGAVLSPLLFLLHIDDLHTVETETMKVALYADYVSLISSHHNKLVAELQHAVTAAFKWNTCKKWRSSGSYHRTKPRPYVLTANHFFQSIQSGSKTLQT